MPLLGGRVSGPAVLAPPSLTFGGTRPAFCLLFSIFWFCSLKPEYCKQPTEGHKTARKSKRNSAYKRGFATGRATLVSLADRKRLPPGVLVETVLSMGLGEAADFYLDLDFSAFFQEVSVWKLAVKVFFPLIRNTLFLLWLRTKPLNFSFVSASQ